MRCFVVAGFLLTSASRGPSAIAEPLVSCVVVVAKYGYFVCSCNVLVVGNYALNLMT